jgi:hypothetical protein
MEFVCLFDRRHSGTEYAFRDVNNKKWRKWCKFVSPFLFNNTYGIPVIRTDTKSPTKVFYVWLVDLKNICDNTTLKRDSLKMMIFENVCSTWSMVHIKDAFWYVNNKKWSGAILFHLSNLKTLMAYLCSKRTPNMQIKYFMFDWWIYRLFVLNTTLKRNSVQMMIFVNVCSTWSKVYIKDAIDM